MSKFVRIELKDQIFFKIIFHILGQLPVTFFSVLKDVSLHFKSDRTLSFERSASYLQTSMFLDFTREDRATSGYM